MSRRNLKCSVILPTYNRYYSIKYAIQSVLRQTYKKWELVIVDDSTSCDTSNYIQQLNNPKVIYHKPKKKLGSARARNNAIKLSTGEILLMAEDDIWLEEHCIEEIVKTFTEQHADAVCFKMRFIKGLNIEEKYDPHIFYPLAKSVVHSNEIPYVWHDWFGEMSESRDSGKYVQVRACPSVFAMRRDVLEKVGYYDEKYIGNCYREETDLQLRIVRSGHKIVYTPKTFCFHFRFEGKTEGNRAMNQIKYEYYTLRNHFLFLRKFYSQRVLPMFFLFVPYRYLYYAPQRILSYKHVKKLKVNVFPFP